MFCLFNYLFIYLFICHKEYTTTRMIKEEGDKRKERQGDLKEAEELITGLFECNNWPASNK